MVSLTSLREHVNRGYVLEAKGRELAFLRDEIIGDKDDQWLSEMKGWHGAMAYMLRRINAAPIFNIIDPLILSCDYGEQTAILLLSLISHEESKRPRKSRLFDIFGERKANEIRWLLKEYDFHQSKVTKKSGLWLLDRIPLGEYTYSALINDFTSCFHQILNYLSKILGIMTELIEERVFIAERNDYIEKLVEKWWRACEILEKNGLYYERDFKELKAVIRGDKCELRVGSAPGHATHVEDKKTSIRAMYYDTDESVHVIFISLCRLCDINVLRHVEHELTIISTPRLYNIDKKFFIAILPFITSMDLRIAGTISWLKSRWSSNYIELTKKLKARDYIELEMCKLAGSDLLRELM